MSPRLAVKFLQAERALYMTRQMAAPDLIFRRFVMHLQAINVLANLYRFYQYSNRILYGL